MRLLLLTIVLLVSGSLSAQTQGAIKRVRHVSRFELAVACIKKYEGLRGPKHHPLCRIWAQAIAWRKAFSKNDGTASRCLAAL